MKKDIRLSQFYIKHLLTHLQHKGLDLTPYEPKQRWGINQAALKVPLSVFTEICELARTDLGEALFALQVASKTVPPTHGVLGLLLQSCGSIGEVIRLGYKFQHLTRTGYLSTLTFDGEKVTSRLETDGNSEENASFVEYCHGSLFSIASHLTGHQTPIKALEVHFKHAPRAPIKFYKKYLNAAEIKFNQAENQVIFSRKLMDQPLYLADSSVKEKLLNEVNRQLKEVSSGNSLSEKIKQSLQQQDPFIPLSLEDCARQLNSSASTIKRHLAEEGTNYRKLMDAVRLDITCYYLRESDLSIEDISMKSGFSSTGAFSRAFKRLTNQSPLSYRKNQTE